MSAHPGSKRARRRDRARRAAWWVCGCWHCLPGKTKRREMEGPRSTARAVALHDQQENG